MSRLRTRLTTLAAAGALLVGGGVIGTTVSARAATARCGGSALAVTSTFTDSGAGHSWLSLIFRNTQHATCTLYGYPGLDALNSSGHVLAHAKRTLAGYGGGASGVHTVTLAYGGYASASVEWLNFNPSTSGVCAFSQSVATTPANTYTTSRLPLRVSSCELQVHPTVTGTPGFPDYGPAQAYWISGSHLSSASAGLDWSRAESWLKAGKDYPTQVAELAQLSKLPDADQTAAQHATWLHDVRALDAFFATPGRYL